jgi:hypothetical protein
MIFLFQQSQELILALLKKFFKKYHFIFFNAFYPLGEPILRCERSEAILVDCHVVSLLATTSLCYRAFAVDNHRCMPCASHPLILGRGGGSRLVNIPGYFG